MYTVDKDRGGYSISITNSGNIRVKVWSAYSDEQDMTYYIRPYSNFNASTDWSEIINDYGTTRAEQLVLNELPDNPHIFRVIKY